jgi:ketosteroid isomerase-like protein
MLRSNADTIRSLFDAFSRRDAAAAAELFNEDAKFEPASTPAAGRETYVGPEGVRSYFRDLDETWQRFEVTITELLEHDDCVVVLGRVYAAGNGFVGDDPAGFVWRLRNGRIVFGRVFTSHDGALAAAGLGGGEPREPGRSA